MITPPITKNLIIINIILFLLVGVVNRWGIDLENLMGLHFFLAPNFSPIQLLTYMFMHASWSHLFFNMFSLWMFGRIIESVLGSKRFLFFFLFCGIGAGFCQELVQLVSYYAQGLDQYTQVDTGSRIISMNAFLSTWTTVGASGSCYGVLLAYGMLFPNERVMLLIPPIPMKAKYMVLGFIIMELVIALGMPGDSVAHFAHLGGAAAGWIFIRIYRAKQMQQTSGFTSWEEYDPNKKTFWQKVKDKFQTSKPKHTKEENIHRVEPTSVEELTQILQKIKRSGYESLTAEEKEKLFRR